MAAVTRRQYKGAAASTTTTNALGVADTSVTLTATTGFPSTPAVPFFVVIDPGTASEEKCLATISGSTLTLTRAQDDTTAAVHASGATLFPVYSADDADEANLFASTMTTRGDLLTMGAGPTVARVALGASGTVLKSDGTDASWATVAAANIASDAVTTAKIQDGAVTGVKQANFAVSTKTASYTLVAADRNTRIAMNSTSSTTITVNTSLFAAGDTLELLNINTGVCTVTAGTATVSSAGSLAIPANGGGTLYFTSAGVSIFFPTAVTASSGGLVFINSTTFTTQSSVSLPLNTFTATYDNYLIVFSTSAISTTMTMTGRLRAAGTDNSTANYSNMYNLVDNAAGGNSSISNAGQTAFNLQFATTDRPFQGFIDVSTPFLTQRTAIFPRIACQTSGGSNRQILQGSGQIDLTTSFDSFSIIASTGTMTGVVKAYGYANS